MYQYLVQSLSSFRRASINGRLDDERTKRIKRYASLALASRELCRENWMEKSRRKLDRSIDRTCTMSSDLSVVSFLFQCVSNQWQISATRPPPSEEGVQIFRNRPCPHTARSKSSHARRARASSVTRTIFIITPSSSVAKCHDSTAPIVFTERNTCPTFAPTSVESIPVTTSTPLTFVKFRTDE